MRENVVALPILVAFIMTTIVAVTDPEPRTSSSVASETRIAAVEVPQVWTYAIPRFVADLEGDLSPVGDGSTNRLHDFPAFQLRPTPTPTPIAAPVVATVRPLPVLSVPSSCPPVFVEVFGVNAPAACNIARCESGYNVGAVNFNPSTGDDSHGLMQINFYSSLGPGRLALVQSLGYSVATVEEAKTLMHTDAVANLRAAYVISSGGLNWQPWSCNPW